MNSSNHTYRDQVALLAGEYADDLFEFLNGNMEPYILAARAKRHLWLAAMALSPGTAAAKSALVRFGWDADPTVLLSWIEDRPTPLLWPVLRRCMPAAALPEGFYRQIAARLQARPRTARVWLSLGSMPRQTWACTLALPDELIEPSVITLMNGNLARAEAVRELWALAMSQRREPANLARAIRSAKNLDGLERLLTKAVDGDRLPVAPLPPSPEVRALKTAGELSKWAYRLGNCMRRSRAFAFRERTDAFFIWLADEPDGPAMIRVARDQAGLRLAEVKVASNRKPSDRLYQQIVAAFASVNVPSRPSADDMLMAL